jgi:transposase
MRLNPKKICNLNSLRCFKHQLIQWCEWGQAYGKSEGYLFKPMIAAAKSILNHVDVIIRFAASRITNAFIEGPNSVLPAVKRKAREYRSSKNRIILLDFVAR